MIESDKMSILSNVIITRNLILRGFCIIYLAAFLGFYYQAEGLFSPLDGVLPPVIEPIKGKLFHDKLLSFIDRPSWIRILKSFQIATFPAIELITLSGAFISFFGVVSSRFCILPVFATLWTLYYSLVDITQTFHHQADDLLLEAGLVVILLAPGISHKHYGVSDNVMLQLMRWVLFRFFFASGAVKLSSGCPHWWNLTALKHHLLTLPMPTHLAFYAYYIPDGYLKLTTVFVNISELLCPWLFFAPVRSLRILAFYWQVFLQVCIIATGNYGFLNFMIIVMLFSLLDDSHYVRYGSTADTGVNFKKVFSFLLTMLTVFFVMVITMTFYKFSWVDGNLDVSIILSKADYMDLLRQMIKFAPFIATISIINVFLQSCISHPNISSSRGFFPKISKIVHLLALTMIAISLIGCSTVPHGALHPETNISNTTIGKAYDDVFNKYHIVHEYGLHLRRMRSERLELSFQYTDADSLENSNIRWKEYDVAYRPIKKNQTLPYAGIFFSRFDFRMHEAVGKGAKLEKNLWLVGLLKQLLRNNRAALLLLGSENLMKVRMPPKFVRVAFIKVSYVPREDASKNAGLWTRKIMNAEYLPPMSLTGDVLKGLLAKLEPAPKKEKETYPALLKTLQQTRLFFEAADGHLLINTFVFASFVIMMRFR